MLGWVVTYTMSLPIMCSATQAADTTAKPDTEPDMLEGTLGVVFDIVGPDAYKHMVRSIIRPNVQQEAAAAAAGDEDHSNPQAAGSNPQVSSLALSTRTPAPHWPA